MFPITISIGMLLAQIFGFLYIESYIYSWRIMPVGMVAPLWILFKETLKSIVM